MTSASIPPRARFLRRLEGFVEARAIGDDGQVLPRTAYLRAIDRDLPRALRKLPFEVIQGGVLEDENRVRVLERRRKHPARVRESRRREHLDARDMRVPPLEAVRVLRGELLSSPGRHTNDQRHVELAPRHMKVRRRGVHDLIRGK